MFSRKDSIKTQGVNSSLLLETTNTSACVNTPLQNTMWFTSANVATTRVWVLLLAKLCYMDYVQVFGERMCPSVKIRTRPISKEVWT